MADRLDKLRDVEIEALREVAQKALAELRLLEP
jgi:hypothetical protein